MRRVAWWFLQDVVNIVAPAFQPVDRPAATLRAARWLIGIGIFLTLFGAIGASGEATSYERQDATIVGRHLSYFHTRSIGSTVHHVTLRLEDGTHRDVTNAPLYDALGSRTEVAVSVDVRPDVDSIDAVYLEGKRYGTGRAVAGIVIVSLICAVGVYVLLRGIGRRRRARYLLRNP